LNLLNGNAFAPSSILAQARQEFVDLTKHIKSSIIDRPPSVTMNINGFKFEAMVPTNDAIIIANPDLCTALN
jgi:hypothetical protein